MVVVDPIANNQKVFKECGVELTDINEIHDMDVLLFTVEHECFKELELKDLNGFFRCDSGKVIIDVKSLFASRSNITNEFIYWNL